MEDWRLHQRNADADSENEHEKAQDFFGRIRNGALTPQQLVMAAYLGDEQSRAYCQRNASLRDFPTTKVHSYEDLLDWPRQIFQMNIPDIAPRLAILSMQPVSISHRSNSAELYDEYHRLFQDPNPPPEAAQRFEMLHGKSYELAYDAIITLAEDWLLSDSSKRPEVYQQLQRWNISYPVSVEHLRYFNTPPDHDDLRDPRFRYEELYRCNAMAFTSDFARALLAAMHPETSQYGAQQAVATLYRVSMAHDLRVGKDFENNDPVQVTLKHLTERLIRFVLGGGDAILRRIETRATRARETAVRDEAEMVLRSQESV